MQIKNGKWEGIVLHHTAGKKSDTVVSVRKSHKSKGYGDIGYHYFVEFPGTGAVLKEGRSDKYVGAHDDAGDYNKTHIGVAMAGNYCINILSYTEYEKVIEFLCGLCRKYGVPAGKILGHKETKATACPGNINLSKLRSDVEARLKSETDNKTDNIEKIVSAAFEKGFIGDKNLWTECMQGKVSASASQIKALFENIAGSTR